MLKNLVVIMGLLLGAGLFARGFVRIGDRHPNTDLYLRVLRLLEKAPEAQPRERR